MTGRIGQSKTWQLFGVVRRAGPGLTVLWWALVVVRALLPAAFTLAMGALVAAVQERSAPGLPLVLLGVAFVAGQALGPLHDAVSSNLGERTIGWLHDRLLEATTAPAGIAHLERPDLADALADGRDFGFTGPGISYCLPGVGAGFAAFIGGLAQAIILVRYRWWAPLMLGGAWVSTQKLFAGTAIWRARHDDDVIEQQRRADYAFRLSVDAPAAKEVRLFGLADWVLGGFVVLRRALLERSWADRRITWRQAQAAMAVVVGANVVFFWSLAADASAGRIGLAAVVVYAQAALGVGTLAFGLFNWELHTASEPVPVVLGLSERMAPAGRLSSGSRDADSLPSREIRFEGVSFAYPAGSGVFDGLDLTIPAGRSLAIVGRNGAGKTTLAKLLCRLYDPTAGRVLADDTDLRELDVESWRSRVAAVFQDFVRYELSLRENVEPSGVAGDADIVRALRAARGEDLAGLDTILSPAYEGGTDLSGGQWQRVALARALCRVAAGAGVVVLDEPTAMLDVRGEAEIFERLLDATRGCTTILISHRFSTVRRADRICVVERGHVVEIGTHDELMNAAGRYRTMFDLQAAHFAGEPEEDHTA